MAVVEVERLWNRFKQLGPDKNGNIPQKVLDKSDLFQDTFVKNVFNYNMKYLHELWYHLKIGF